MKEVATLMFVLLVVLSVINLTSIIVTYHTIKADINDILDEKIKSQLENSLQPIWRTFFKKVIYHANEDHFSDRGHYNQYVAYLNIEGFKIDMTDEVDLFHRHPEPELEWDFTSFAKNMEKVEEERELEVEVIKD